MQEEQRKNLIINVVATIILLGFAGTGYFMFTQKDATVSFISNTSTESVTEVINVGVEIDRTMRDLGDLKKAVADSIAVFDMRSFKDLTNFSLDIQPERIGRQNPFTPTEWKLKMLELEAAAQKSGGQGSAPSQQTTSPATTAISGHSVL